MPGVRAFVLSVRNSAPVSASRPPATSHFVPSSKLFAFSGSTSTVAVASVRPSADGLNDVP